MVSPDGVALSRMVFVSASVNLHLHHKVHKFSSGTSCDGIKAENLLMYDLLYQNTGKL